MKKSILALAFVVSLGIFSYGQKQIELNDFRDSVSYSIGISMGESLLKTDIDDINQEVFFEALRQKINKEKTLWGTSKSDTLLVNYIMEKRNIKAAENKAKGEAFLTQNGKRDNVFTTPSGLQYEMLEMAEGERPSLYSTVKVLYKGMHIDGTVFDKRWDENNPLEVRVMDMIDGWVEGLQMLPVGAVWKFYVPSGLAYGERGAGRDIGANETLIFEVKLLDIVSTDVPNEQ